MSMAIIIGFSALLFLCACALIWSRWPVWMKGILLLGVTALYFFGYRAVHDIWGRPSVDALPERFVVMAAFVEEPHQKNPGAIYMWVSEIRDDDGQVLDPRAYKLPYSRPLHTRVDEALERGRDGVSQMGVASSRTFRPGKGKGGAWLQPGNDEQEILLRDLPRPQLPEK
ncbi:MAG: hypothetical protein R3E83_22440 [Burkholderiaceae bacterium]